VGWGGVLDGSLCMCIVVNYVDTAEDIYFPLRTQSNNGPPLLVQMCNGTYTAGLGYLEVLELSMKFFSLEVRSRTSTTSIPSFKIN
jgi:hypothetical protein